MSKWTVSCPSCNFRLPNVNLDAAREAVTRHFHESKTAAIQKHVPAGQDARTDYWKNHLRIYYHYPELHPSRGGISPVSIGESPLAGVAKP